MTTHHRLLPLLGTALALVATPSWGVGQESSPRQIIDDLIAQRRPAPAVVPETQPAIETIPSRVGMPASEVDLDPAVVGVLPGVPLPRLRREGEFIIERPGQLLELETEGLWVFAFDHIAGQPDLRPMIVQKCQRLTSMQDTLGQRRGQDLAFTLTGQVHTHRDVNYLLPTAIAGTRKLPPAEKSNDTSEGSDKTADGSGSNPGGPSDITTPVPVNTQPPVDFDSPSAAGPGADPIDLMEQLLSDRQAPPKRRPTTTGAATASDAALDAALLGIRPDANKEEKLRREGEYLINRAGRIIRGTGANVMFAFEADGQDPAAAETPLMLMPCKLLELMEDTVTDRGDQMVFVISGRVHTHRGANYLLPTTMRLRYDLGDLEE